MGRVRRWDSPYSCSPGTEFSKPRVCMFVGDAEDEVSLLVTPATCGTHTFVEEKTGEEVGVIPSPS
jgi:hypothetical protein